MACCILVGPRQPPLRSDAAHAASWAQRAPAALSDGETLEQTGDLPAPKHHLGTKGQHLKGRMAGRLIQNDGLWLTVAAVYGASAVGLGAYGAHAFHPKDKHFVGVFDSGNKYHLIHSLLIAAAPVAR
jgi:Protein of unknown function (DUF423)